jgi:hypothetical protein
VNGSILCEEAALQQIRGTPLISPKKGATRESGACHAETHHFGAESLSKIRGMARIGLPSIRFPYDLKGFLKP